MAQRAVPSREAVTIQCVCGGVVEFDPQLLGRIIPCRHCGRYLRPALQFMMAEREVAPNLTAQCTTCGHFIVEDVGRIGRRIRCKVCKSQLVMPQPVVKFDTARFVRVPRKALQANVKKAPTEFSQTRIEMARLRSAAHAGRISLRPGEHICVNPHCGALLGVRAIVCPKCATNRLTGERYEGPGPAGDPVGTWREV